MQGIPKDGNLTFIIGGEMIQLCIEPHQVQVHLQNKVSIAIYTQFEHLRGDEVLNVVEGDAAGELVALAVTAVSLLGHTVVAATNERDEALLIEFSNGESLRLHAGNATGESFRLTCPEIKIIV